MSTTMVPPRSLGRLDSSAGSPRPACPHCAHQRAHSHGSFRRKDGTLEQRYICRACRRTFNRCTNTPLHYIKKRDRWANLADAMVKVHTVRRAASILRVTVTTAFRWRHRLLDALRDRPQPKLDGSVAVAEAYVPFSEKGVRGSERRTGQGLFARKPSCVLLLHTREQQTAIIASGGRPRVEDLVERLAPVIQAGAEIWSSGLGPYDQACRRLGLRRSNVPEQRGIQRFWAAESMRRSLFGWLGRFQGVATRYLDNYLCWFRFARRVKTLTPAAAVVRFLVESKIAELGAA